MWSHSLRFYLFRLGPREATIDPRRRRSRRRRRHLPSPLSLGISVTSPRSTYLPTYTNLIDTRPVSSRFDSPLPLSLRDGDEDVTPSRTGSSTGSFASQPRSNRSIALRSVLRIPPVDLPPRTRLRNYRT